MVGTIRLKSAISSGVATSLERCEWRLAALELPIAVHNRSSPLGRARRFAISKWTLGSCRIVFVRRRKSNFPQPFSRAVVCSRFSLVDPQRQGMGRTLTQAACPSITLCGSPYGLPPKSYDRQSLACAFVPFAPAVGVTINPPKLRISPTNFKNK